MTPKNIMTPKNKVKHFLVNPVKFDFVTYPLFKCSDSNVKQICGWHRHNSILNA